MAHLTKAVVEGTKVPASGQRFIRDDSIKGFALRVIATGAKSFVWEGRIKGRMRRVTLGKFPDLTVALAREKAIAMRGRIAQGDDPATEAQEARNEATFEELTELYLERHARPHKRSASRDEYILKRYVPEAWNKRRLSDIGRADVAKLHARIGEEHGHYAANRTLALLRTMFNLARTWELLKGDNPAQGIKAYREEKRQRFLSPEELQQVNAALAKEPDWRWRAYFPLALMLGTRKSELLAMRWQDVDLNQRTWRIPETKAGNSHLLPLPSPAAAILETLPSRGQSEWVFPSEDSKAGRIVEPAKAWQRIRMRAGVTDVRIHDLRHTLASWLVAQGFNLPLIGRALNHTQVSTTNRYAHLALDPVRTALEQTAVLMTAYPSDSPAAPPAKADEAA
jgi:integrase